MEKTIKNLTKAFIGESQARNRYSIYAEIAQKEGLEQISSIFLETADQEKEHARWLFKFINELKEKSGEAEKYEEITVEAGAPTDLGTTRENLKAAIAGESYEFESMYPEFSKTAGEEGLNEISARLMLIGKAESHHKERYEKILEALEKNSVFKKEEKNEWVCRQCGYVHTGSEAPQKCPACEKPQAFFQLRCEIY
ncbi:MAG: ferritin family protein [Candidatus Moranbacteria bacterium]|nr:ferritin family protein [Candidatus Moranbacteria bacterium]